MPYPFFIFALAVFAILHCFSVDAAANALPRLETRGTRIVEADSGKAVELRGVNLGNWLLIEPGVFPDNPSGLKDEWSLKEILRQRFGDEECERLMELWREHFLTEADFDRIADFGFNFVRLGFDHAVVEEAPGVLQDDWYRHFDRAIEACEARGLYVLIDLHGAPRRQSAAKPTGRRGVNRFFFEPAAQDRAMTIWRAIAHRYRDRPAVFAYEALNEPWGAGTQDLRGFVYRWYDEIRTIDPDKILCFPGWSNGLEKVYSNPHELDQTNVIFDMHFYQGFFGWGKPNTDTHEAFFRQTVPRYEKLMSRWQSPLLIGEFNVVAESAGGAAMMRRYFDLASDPGFAMCAWTIKEYKAEGGIGDWSWGLTTNALPLQSPDWRHAPLETIEAWIRSLPEVPIDPHPRLIEALKP